jgi:hypothetical protein
MSEPFEFPGSSCQPYERTYLPGTYFLEVWGGSGGTNRQTTGGNGGYSKGTLTLTSSTLFYIYIGGQGQCLSGGSQTVLGGCNGGGSGLTYTSSSYYMCRGVVQQIFGLD